MPSPDDKVTIRQISELTGIRQRIITCWRDAGYIKSAGRCQSKSNRYNKGKSHLFLWGDIEKVLANYKPGFNDQSASDARCPEGFISIVNAAARLRIGQDTIRRLVRSGHIQEARVPMNGLGTRKCFVYVELASVEKMIAERTSSGKPGQGILSVVPGTNPLLDANDEVCLKARRELLEKRGICVAKKKKAG